MPETADARVTSGSYWLPCTRRSPGRARQALREFLSGAGDERFSAAGELVVSELVTNAVAHARLPGRLIWVRFELGAEELRIEVHDPGRGRPVVQQAAEGDESGRGLWLVECLAARWGCCPRTGGIGKIVWAIVLPPVVGEEED
ncbi:serine/threonine-protein kinase RsbW [Streptacidiphilus sp. BW17]|uniref:ATP-binding protein n=1 Tax=Streptacidiphilus sp. BW17 TaxID=3156274 RepID=UPI0035185983